MRRLSIIDLEGGWQPLWNEDRSIALVANGELSIPAKIRRRPGFTLPINVDLLWLPFGVGKAAALIVCRLSG